MTDGQTGRQTDRPWGRRWPTSYAQCRVLGVRRTLHCV